jgi:hypothetical protein
VIHPNGHNDNGNAVVIQELEEHEARNTDLPLSPDAKVPIPELSTRAKQRARQQIRQNRFVIIAAGAVVIALLIFVATSMPHRGAPQKAKSRGATATEDLALESGTVSNDKSLFPITDSGRPVTKESHEGFLNERDLQRTATKPALGTKVASGAGTLGSIPPFGDQQPWQAPPYQPGSGAGTEAPDLGKAEREAMEKSSLIYVRSASASSASAQARELFNNLVPELGLGLATGTRLRARLESAASTAVRTPVLAVIEYNYERDGEIIVPAGAKAVGKVRMLFLTEIALWKYRAQLPGFELPTALATQQRQFDEGVALALEGMADRLEGRSPKSPSFEDSVTDHEGNAEAYAKAPEQTFSDRESALLSLRRRIQKLTTSLTQEI